jgi:hypothetical protein
MHAPSLRKLTTAAALALPMLSWGQTQDLTQAIATAAHTGYALEVAHQGKRYVVAPAQSGPCPTVGVIHASGKHHRGGPRIDNYRVCENASPALLNEVSPALPDDEAFKQIAFMTIQAALRYGSLSQDWHDYRVESRRLSEPNARGCAQVETTISADRLLVSYDVGRICP